jgi:hypothetical protein
MRNGHPLKKTVEKQPIAVFWAWHQRRKIMLGAWSNCYHR